MIKYINFLFIAVFLFFSSCTKVEKIEMLREQNAGNQGFDFSDYTIVGTIGGKSKSVFAISFLEKNKAIFYNSNQNFSGEYRIEDNWLIFEVKDEANYRIVKCLLNDQKQITYAVYQALENLSLTSAELIKIPNQLAWANKTFLGKELKMGNTDKENWYYKFDQEGEHLGKGADLQSIVTEKEIIKINNAVFRADSGIGYIKDDVLTLFRQEGLYYFGVYEQVK